MKNRTARGLLDLICGRLLTASERLDTSDEPITSHTLALLASDLAAIETHARILGAECAARAMGADA